MPFTIETPPTLRAALDVLAGGEDGVRPLSGGTGLTLLMKYGFFEPTLLVDLRALGPELGHIEVTADGGMRLGALVSLRELEDSPLVTDRVPMLHEMLARLASVRVRNVARVGGAVAHGHPQMDLPAVLVALGARIRLQRSGGERWVEASDFFLGYYQTAALDQELVTEVVIPPLDGHVGHYRKVTPRSVDDWPTLGVAVCSRRGGDGSVDLRIVLGAVTSRPLQMAGLERELSGHQPSSALIREAVSDAASELELHDTPTGTARYQRHLVTVHVRRALEEVLGRRKEGGL